MDVENVPEFVEKKIASKLVVFFVRRKCMYSILARIILQENYVRTHIIPQEQYEVVEIEIDKFSEQTCKLILEYMREKTGDKTVPRCFIKQKFVGGFTEVKALHESGELKSKLQMDAE